MPSPPAPRTEHSWEAEQPHAPPAAASEKLISSPTPFTHEDNRRFLQMLREEKERLGVGGAKVEVRFEELAVEAHVRVGRRALPTLINCAVNAAQEILKKNKLTHARNRQHTLHPGREAAFTPLR